MTAHYMLCKVSGSFEQVTQYLGKYFGNIHNDQWNTPEGRIAVILGELYFIRSNSNAAILITVKEAGASETNLELISYAGASGVLDLSWGAHGSYVQRIKNSLQNAGFTVEVTKEIPNYDALSAGALKTTVPK
ncbi:MAG: hypothetical protein CW691_03830 [Candidatus Bathyarchaeum sp.]|nr:MAG: hypothetical protein CW691_03830 [Candidatus Bathyarchaeum sp.]